LGFLKKSLLQARASHAQKILITAFCSHDELEIPYILLISMI